MSRSDDMTRLREQVEAGYLDRQAGRRSRAEFVTNLRRSGIELEKENQVANKERGRNLMETLAAYMKTLAGHEKGRKQEAARLYKTRAKFVVDLTRTVASLRKRLVDESLAAYAAWFGPTLAERATASARMKEEADAVRRKEEADAARMKQAAAAARMKEEADAARMKEEADAVRRKEEADAARMKEEAAAARMKQAAKGALIKEAAKAAPVKVTKKPANKVRNR